MIINTGKYNNLRLSFEELIVKQKIVKLQFEKTAELVNVERYYS